MTRIRGPEGKRTDQGLGKHQTIHIYLLVLLYECKLARFIKDIMLVGHEKLDIVHYFI
ncbi:MAG: hypothetical protein ACI90V_004424 [Bacillariaceae sp.]|jgi:hypothetical protein